MSGRHSEAEESLRRKEAYNFALFQHNSAAMVVVDRAGKVVKSNLARRRMALPLPELGAPIFDAGAGDTEKSLQAVLLECIASEQVRDLPEQWLGERCVTVTLSPFPEGAIVILDDVTDRKRAEEEAVRQREQLLQADKMVALGTLVSGVAHEVSNPNHAMLLSVAALRKQWAGLCVALDEIEREHGDFDVGLRQYSEIREEIPQLIRVIGQAAESIRDTVTELKNYARPDVTGQQDTIDMNEVVRVATSLMSSVTKKATRQCLIRYSEALPNVHGNGQQLVQVVVNLISNACQALPSRDCAVAIATRHDVENGRVVVEVRDEGVGIPEKDLRRVSDPFFTTKHDTGGTGLGLSVSQKIAETHNGTLTFASKVGEGTVATFNVPVAPRRSAGKDGGS